jgi:hypothetical protein
MNEQDQPPPANPLGVFIGKGTRVMIPAAFRFIDELLAAPVG